MGDSERTAKGRIRYACVAPDEVGKDLPRAGQHQSYPDPAWPHEDGEQCALFRHRRRRHFALSGAKGNPAEMRTLGFPSLAGKPCGIWSRSEQPSLAHLLRDSRVHN